MAKTLNDVPPEMLWEIMAFLDARTLILSSSVCRLWNEIVKSSPGLQYTIELWAEGMVRGPSGTLTRAETLEMLRERRRAWRNMEWKSTTVAEIESLQVCRAYELVSGIFAQQQTGPEFVALSLSRIVQDAESARSDYPFGIDPLDFQDFAVDPTLDLLVIVYVLQGDLAHVECRTLSTKQVHPLAAHSSIVFPHPHDPGMLLSIGIADDIVAVFFLDPAELILYNWRLGTIISIYVRPEFRLFLLVFILTQKQPALEPLLLPIQDFHLLSPRSYILARANEDENRSGQIEIFTFDGDSPNAPKRVATLELPELASRGLIASINVQMGPFCANPNPNTPFSKANERRICMFLIRYNLDVNLDVWARLFVHSSWLERYTLPSVRGDNGTEPTIVPWDEWGPLNSRMLAGDDHRWIRQVHGERAALPCQNKHSLLVLDFGVIPRRAESHLLSEKSSGSPGSATMLEVEPSTMPNEHEVFVEEVTTSLPYRRTIRSVEKRHDLFLIDEDRIIGMNLEDDTAVRQEMTVYTL
ncbi:hypothetical protein B0H16DRAFT_1357026 [Mycena metata]|uniref:F-box domain-containing protein n=1 Tax=Mycena metata TaxID=1033252 RepID=A0AAD7KCR0_9AGAR|nr:hypothetical protein B0H16DRAFT_1357026 [Mycena metata]